MNIKGQGHSLTLAQDHSDSTFLNFFSWETLCRLKPNFMWSLNEIGEQKFVQMVQVTWPRWPPCPYMVKTWKFFFSGTQRPMTLKVCMQHQMLKYYQVYSNDDPGWTMTDFTTRSNLVPCAFVWEKVKTMEFSETIVVYDIKVGICSQPSTWSCTSTKGQGHWLTLVQISPL